MERVASCVVHPDRPGVSVCSKCGAFICAACDAWGQQGFEVFCPDCRAELFGASSHEEPGALMRRAAFMSRAIAYLLDGLLLDGARTLALMGLGWEIDIFEQADLLPSLALSVLMSCVYHSFCWAGFGATPGKALLGLRVVRASDGGSLSLPRALLRWAGYLLSSLPLGLGFIAASWDPQGRAWHDRLAGTLVIRRGR